jgi:hypothetical protein
MLDQLREYLARTHTQDKQLPSQTLQTHPVARPQRQEQANTPIQPNPTQPDSVHLLGSSYPVLATID